MIAAMTRFKRRLPLCVSLGALFVYGLTLGHGLTLSGLSLAAKVAGWDWQPMAGQPLLWLVTLPLRLLPTGWVTLSLNLLSAVCAAVTLGVLARSVTLLLPHRSPAENVAPGGFVLRKEVWFAVAMACVVCGLEFSFWQAATGAWVGELLDLLLLATAIWLLLEHRSDKQELRWIFAATFVWGLGLAENWAMILTFPLFVLALVGLRWVKFFQLRFLLFTTGLLLAGLLVYALLPLANWLAAGSLWSFGEAWQLSFKATKSTIAMLFTQFVMLHPLVTLLVGFYFLVPIAACLIRQQKREAVWFSRLLLGLLLLVCLWLALDPVSGPRQVILEQTGLALPLLTFDYLNALGAGYLAGYFIFVAQFGPRQFGKRNFSWKLQRWFGRATAPLLATLLVVVSVALILRNGQVIWQARANPLTSFGELAVRDLPAGSGVVLSDDPARLIAFQAALSHHNERRHWLPVDTQSLPDPAYRRRLDRLQSSGWLTEATRRTLAPRETSELLRQMARTNRLFYLHPGSGDLFESFYLQPRGVLYELKLFSSDHFAREPLAAPDVARIENLWDGVWATKVSPLRRIAQRRPGAVEKAAGHLALNLPPPDQSRLLGEWYSVALNAWGVELQRGALLEQAQRRFEQALAVNTNNFAAASNLRCNTNLQAGIKMDLTDAPPAARLIGDALRMTTLTKRTGPFDAPVPCFLLGCAFQEIGLPRQAIQQFERAHALAPEASAPGFSLLQLYTRARMHDPVFATAAWVRQATKNTPLAAATDIETAAYEAEAWFARSNRVEGAAILQSVLKKYPGDPRAMDLASRTHLAFGDYTNALQLNTELLTAAPDNVSTLFNQASILLLLGRASDAIPFLDRSLALTNTPKARLNRAMAYLQTGNVDAAEADYLAITNLEVGTGQKTVAYQVNHGLADIAIRRRDTNLAIHHLELCLSNVPPNSDLWREAQTLHNYFKSSSPKR